MTLSTRGIVSAVELVFYVPVAAITLFLTFRHGFKREQGWIYLLIFSLIRAGGAGVYLYAEIDKSTNSKVYTAIYVLFSIGLSPLLMATLGFLGIVKSTASPEVPFTSTRLFRLLRIAITVALIIAITGGSQAASSTNSNKTEANDLRKAAGIIFVILYVALTFIHVVYWQYKDCITRYRRMLLLGISCAVPFLGVRVILTLFSDLSPVNLPGTTGTPTTNFFSKFNTVTGDWQIYVGMGLAMEFIVIIIYCIVGTSLPLRFEDEDPEMVRLKAYGA